MRTGRPHAQIRDQRTAWRVIKRELVRWAVPAAYPHMARDVVARCGCPGFLESVPSPIHRICICLWMQVRLSCVAHEGGARAQQEVVESQECQHGEGDSGVAQHVQQGDIAGPVRRLLHETPILGRAEGAWLGCLWISGSTICWENGADSNWCCSKYVMNALMAASATRRDGTRQLHCSITAW
jgi:hypothetical protein